jgi:methyl-accepting chemotaxis protein
MNDMSRMPERAVSERLRGLVVLSPRQQLIASLEQRLRAPWIAARHSLAGRIKLAAIGLTALLVILGLTVGIAVFGLAARSEQGRILGEAALASAELTASIADSRYYASRYAATGAEAEIERARATLARAKERLAKARESSLDTEPQALEAMEWLHHQVDGFENELTALEHSVAAYGPSASADALAGAIAISGEQLAEQARGVESRLRGASAASAAELAAQSWRLAIVVVALLTVCVMITLAGARFLTRTTATSIREITSAMSGLAKGDRAVAIPGAERCDEIGEMARALTVFRKSADDLVHFQELAATAAQQELARQEAERTRDAAEHARKTELMRALALRFERTVGEVASGVAAASRQLEVTASAMAAAASQSAQLTGEVSRSMTETTAGVTAAASAGDQFAMSIAEISRLASDSAVLAEGARQSAHDADATISGLAAAARQIEQIVGMIDGIAQRTSLLALNASIEAARSGEAGRGFAVVAGEVKDLAGQTRAATGAVADQIRAIQSSTGESVAALRRIGEQVRAMEGSSIAIAQAVDEQSLAGRDLARNLATAAGGTDAIGESIVQVGETTRSTGTAANQVLEAASDLHKQAAVLRAQVEEFIGYVRTA